MAFVFKIIEKDNIKSVVPWVQKLNGNQVTDAVMEQRFSEMVIQNYECVGIYDNKTLIGVCGLWFCTRHYSGKSVEPDHIFIDEAYRGAGLGGRLFEWIQEYVSEKEYESIELNTYVSNFPSHKFYHNQGFKILGYHFLKKL